MIELAETPPENFDAMAKVPGIGPRFVRRSGRDVMKTLKMPRKAPPKQPANREPPLPAAARRRAKRLTEVRDEVASNEGLPSGLLCPRATVQALALDATDIESFPKVGLTGWRLGLLGERFARALADT
jgi:ribonuclease D